MFQRVKVFSVFVTLFVRYGMLVREVLLCLIGLILIGGIVFAFVEDLDFSSSIYFAFITGLTIGYGEITPQTPIGRVVAVLIGVIGMIFIGLTVGIATRALNDLQQMKLHQDELKAKPN